MTNKWTEKHRIKHAIVRCSLPALLILSLIFLTLGITAYFHIMTACQFYGKWLTLSVEQVNYLYAISQGLVGTTFALAGALLLSLTLLYQTISSKKKLEIDTFLKMVDYHRDNVSRIRIKSYRDFAKDNANLVYGGRAFVLFKLQLFDILDAIRRVNAQRDMKFSADNEISLAYLLLYYGIDKEWETFVDGNFKGYDPLYLRAIEAERAAYQTRTKRNIGRTNQTILSPYYRNMYNAVRYIDESIYLSQEEKYQYVKILRTQLSNSELAVFFFNIQSKFGKNWKSYSKNGKEIDHNLVERYQLIKNLPDKYLRDYNHKDLFDMEYEEDELNGLT